MGMFQGDIRMFAASVIHELSQPLAAVALNAESALLGLRNGGSRADQRAQARLSRVVEAASHALAVLQGMHQLAADARPEPVLCDLREIVRAVLATLDDELRAQRIALRLELAPQPLWADPVQIRQVLRNLLANAIDAMREVTQRPRVLSIRSRLSDGAMLVEVADAGCGIAPELAARVFDPLVSGKPGGMGMGLAICRAIVETHGGDIWAAPRTPHGSVFAFRLPHTGSSPTNAVRSRR
jgi:signal transduction histidine kinase